MGSINKNWERRRVLKGSLFQVTPLLTQLMNNAFRRSLSTRFGVCVPFHSLLEKLSNSRSPILFSYSFLSVIHTRKCNLNCWAKSNIYDWYSWHRKSMRITQLVYVWVRRCFLCIDLNTYNIDNSQSIYQEGNSDI